MRARTPEDLAERAYNAYGDHAQWLNYLGTPIPRWEALNPVVQSHWLAVATAFLETIQSMPDDNLNG